MRLHTQLPIDAGLLRGPGADQTLLLKSTWLPTDAGARLASQKQPLTSSIVHHDGAHLYYPSDLCPQKRRTDLVIAGLRGGTDGPTTRVSVDEWTRELRAWQDGDVTHASTRGDDGDVFVRLLPPAGSIAAYAPRGFQLAEALLSMRTRNMPRSIRVESAQTRDQWSWELPLCAFVLRPDGMRWDLDPVCDTIFLELTTRTVILVHRVVLPAQVAGALFVHRGELDPSEALLRLRSGGDSQAIQSFEVGQGEALPFRQLDGWTARPNELGAHTVVRPVSSPAVDPGGELPFPRRRAATMRTRSAASSPASATQPSSARMTGLPFTHEGRPAAQAMHARAVEAPSQFNPNETVQLTPSVLERHLSASTVVVPPVAPSPAVAAAPPHPLPFPPRPLVSHHDVADEETAEGQPSPAIDESGMTLDDYARVRARIRSGESLDRALRALSFDDGVYRAFDRKVAQELAREARDGKSTLANRIKDLVRAVRAE